ncbi:MAG: hypothetical protein K9M03_00225 [Kiritimatiellales bacterium]|nr:hypothetical protein [Kiritimatiellales bacterium]
MNIIVKSFDGVIDDKITLEKALGERKIHTCISIADTKSLLPNLQADEHIWIDAKAQRAGQYPRIDWNTITPLDEAIIEKMRHSEAVFFTMIERYDTQENLLYEERKRQYFDHLRFWNHILATKKIDLLLMYHIPHQCYDYVLYNLCKLKDIPILMIERTCSFDTFFIIDDWEESSRELGERLSKLQEEYGDPKKQIPLDKKYEKHFLAQTERDAEPWYMEQFKDQMQQKGFISKWVYVAIKILLKRTGMFVSCIISPTFWRRKINQHNTAKFYDRTAKIPDLNKPYIYVPLHLQPEATTSPMAGAFIDQERIIQLLAWCMPPDISIYVKEHPCQGERMRSKEFYQSLLSIPTVTFVPKKLDTFTLTKNAVAIATATGTAGLEGLFRGVPVLMFGHRFYQYAPGVHMIRTVRDCEQAMEKILKKKERPSLRDMRLFLRAVQETGTYYEDVISGPNEKAIRKDRAEILGDKIAQAIQRKFSQ